MVSKFKLPSRWLIGPRLVDLFYHDQARPIEWLSFGLLLLNFTVEFATNPAILDRDNYTGFAVIGAEAWVVITALLAGLQLLAIFWHGERALLIRGIALICGLAFWITVTVTFGTSGVSTTATRNYLILSLASFQAWVFVLNKFASQP
jgi:hypothetical protein